MEVRCRNRSAQRLVANDLDRAVCPDPSALSPTPLGRDARLRRGPPQVPNQCTERSIALASRFGCASVIATALDDSYCEHRPFPEGNNAGGMWHQCGAGPTWGRRRLDAVHSAKFRRFLRLSLLTRVSGGPYNPPHNGAPSAIGAMARPRSSSLMV
jgi:hypothetical protein